MNTDSLKRLWKTVFGDPEEFIDTFFDVAFAPERCKYVEKDGEAVSALYWLDCEYEGGKLAYIYAVATDPDQRGKGLASQLLLDTHEVLKQQGYCGAVLKPAKGLFPFYERLGYRTNSYINRMDAAAGSVPVKIREVSAPEFAILRRQFLPGNAVVQEGVTLDFLHTFAHFYAADGALLSLFREEPVFFEYLGDPELAPGILAALNIEKATLPTPGGAIPFTMFLPLNCTKTPGYLGITLE